MVHKRARAMSRIVAELAILAIVVVGAAAIYSQFASSQSAVSKAELMATVKPIYTSSGLRLEVSLKNMGGTAATIQAVLIDGADVTADLGWSATNLGPGGELRTVIDAPAGLGPGSHELSITYIEGGQAKTVSFGFTT